MVNKKENTVLTAAKPVPSNKNSIPPKSKLVSIPAPTVEEDALSNIDSDSS